MTLLKKDEKLVHDDLFAITSSLFERRQRATSKWTGPWWSCCDDGSMQAHRVPRSIQVTAVLPSIWTQRSITWKKMAVMFYPYEGGSLKTCDHLLTLMSSQTCMTFFCRTQKHKRLYWKPDYIGELWLPLYCGKKNTAICIRIFNFMFHRRWKVMHIWNDTWVSKWLQNWYFGVIKPLFLLNTLCIT